jgi:tellurite resistance protein
MKPGEAGASLRVLVAVAKADGKIDSDERRLLSLMGAAASIEHETIDVEAELAKLESTSAKHLTLRAAVTVADVDGHCSPAEHALLEKIHRALGAGDELPLEAIEEEEIDVIRPVRGELERATANFLHEITARGEKLTQSAYEALVADLDKKKKAILGKALPTSE